MFDKKKMVHMLSGQLPPEKSCPPLRVRIRIRIGGAIFLGSNCPSTVTYTHIKLNTPNKEKTKDKFPKFYNLAIIKISQSSQFRNDR